MKYICLGYMDETKFAEFGESQQSVMMDECFAYDEENFKAGRFIGGEGLQNAANASTIRWDSGKVLVTDGPYVETKEQLGGILIVEATDLNHAIQIMSNHPSVRYGSIWEIRPALDLESMQAESRERRSKAISAQ